MSMAPSFFAATLGKIYKRCALPKSARGPKGFHFFSFKWNLFLCPFNQPASSCLGDESGPEVSSNKL